MAKLILFTWYFLTISLTSAVAASPNKVLLFRKILVKECRSPGKCLDVVSEQTSPAKVEVSLAKVRKGGAAVLHGEDHLRVEVKGVPFNADLFVNMVKGRPLIYAVLRSGEGTKRHGATKTFPLTDASVEPVIITDQTILIEGKTFRAELIVGMADAAPSAEKSVSLGIRFSRGGETICEVRKEVKNNEDTFFCEGKALGNPATIRVKANLVPPTEEKKNGERTWIKSACLHTRWRKCPTALRWKADLRSLRLIMKRPQWKFPPHPLWIPCAWK